MADSNLVAPFKYHSVRGWASPVRPVETLNRTQCEFVQHVLENLKCTSRFRTRQTATLKQLCCSNTVHPEGLSIVPQQERHMVDNNLVVTAMAQIRQIMQENSAAFVQE